MGLNTENVDSVSSIYFYPSSFQLSGSETDSIIYGIDRNYTDLTFLNAIEGNIQLIYENSDTAVINTAMLESVGLRNSSEIIGQDITVVVPANQVEGFEDDLQKSFEIVGVIDSGSGAEIFVNSALFRQNGVLTAKQLKIGSDNVENIPAIRTQIESFGLVTTSPTDTLAEINTIFRYLNVLLVGFGGIGMIVAILGMFNTLTISLLERTKEIGLMVALGARSIDIKQLFIYEALLLSAFGSLIGIGSAFILGRFVNILFNVMASGRGVQNSFDLFSNPIALILGITVFMICIGLTVVFIPARRAQNINPIVALRSE